MTKEPSKKKRIIPTLILILLVLLFLWQRRLGNAQREAEQNRTSLAEKQQLLDRLKAQQDLKDSIAALRHKDSIIMEQIAQEKRTIDSLNNLSKKQHVKQVDPTPTLQKEMLSDTTRPELRISPTTGRYFKPFEITSQCNESPCTVFSSPNTKEYTPFTSPTLQKTSATLYFYAIDSAGNSSDTLYRKYEFEKEKRSAPKGMTSIPMSKDGKTVVFMDEYEWPNKVNEKPKVFVSQNEAAKLCEEVGKRLCTKNEWQTACKGKYNSTFPYGETYDQNNCVTNRNKPARSGRSPDCRSFYGTYDMSGNVWEWTSTQHETRSTYYYASGGNWSSKDASTCEESKYSFFPQNQYQFVGFRCCKE